MTVNQLPALNAFFNFCSGLFLLAGFIFIKNGIKKAHIFCMTCALVISVAFLVSYLIYHYHVGHKPFTGGEGLIKIFYFSVLIPHIILAVVMCPMIVVTFFHGFKGNFIKHKKIAKITFPIWSYVSVTGVIIYIMLYRI